MIWEKLSGGGYPVEVSNNVHYNSVKKSIMFGKVFL